MHHPLHIVKTNKHTQFFIHFSSELKNKSGGQFIHFSSELKNKSGGQVAKPKSDNVRGHVSHSSAERDEDPARVTDHRSPQQVSQRK